MSTSSSLRTLARGEHAVRRHLRANQRSVSWSRDHTEPIRSEISASQARSESSEGVDLQQARVPLQDPADQRAGERQQGTSSGLHKTRLANSITPILIHSQVP